MGKDMQRVATKTNSIYLLGLLACLLSVAVVAYQMEMKILILCVSAVAGAFIVAKPEYGIIIFLASFLLTTPAFLIGSGFFTLNNILGLLFCFLLSVHLFREKNLWFLRTRQIQLMAAIGLVFILSLLFAKKPPVLAAGLPQMDLQKKELWDYFTQFIFVIFLIHFIHNPRSIKIIFLLFISLITVSALSAILFGIGSGDDYRAASSFGINMAKNSNHLAFYGLFAITILWYWRQETNSPFFSLMSLACIGGLIYLILLCASRNAFFNILFLALILLVESGIKPGRIIAAGFLIGLIGMIAVNFIPEQNLHRLTAMKADPKSKDAGRSLIERVQTLQTGMKMFSDHNILIGIGPGNFRWMRLLYYDHKKLATHNSYLWALLSGGILALVLYLALFWNTWKDLRWMEKQPIYGLSPPRWTVKTLRTMLLLFLLFSVFTEAWLQIILFLIVGLTISMKRLYATADQQLV
jgi:hypothetical protein